MFWPGRQQPQTPPVVLPQLPYTTDPDTGLDVCPARDCSQPVTEPGLWVAKGRPYCGPRCGAHAANYEPPQYAWPD